MENRYYQTNLLYFYEITSLGDKDNCVDITYLDSFRAFGLVPNYKHWVPVNQAWLFLPDMLPLSEPGWAGRRHPWVFSGLGWTG